MKYLWGFIKKNRNEKSYPKYTKWHYIDSLKDQHTVLLKLLAQWNKNQKQIIFFFCYMEIVAANILLYLLFLEDSNKMWHVIIWIICLTRLLEKFTCQLNSRDAGMGFQRLAGSNLKEKTTSNRVLWTYKQLHSKYPLWSKGSLKAGCFYRWFSVI